MKRAYKWAKLAAEGPELLPRIANEGGGGTECICSKSGLEHDTSQSCIMKFTNLYHWAFLTLVWKNDTQELSV